MSKQRPETEELAIEKTLDHYFKDWESHVFGLGYGSGEEHVIPALRRFFELTPPDVRGGTYDYRVLEKELGATVAWLLINILGRADILEYGTSPRYAWLTGKGERLHAYLASKSNEELVELVCSRDEDDIICSPDACNCGVNGYIKGRICPNPFFLKD